MTRTTRLRALLLTLLTLAMLVGTATIAACGGSSDDPSSDASSTASGPVAVTDDGGDQVSLDAPADKVVSVAPANTEIAFAVGAGDKLVGVTTYCDYPAEAKAIAKIGDFSNPSLEKIVALEPDLVLVTSGEQDRFRAKLADLGIASYMVDPTDLDELYADLENVGALMGVGDQADTVVADMKEQVAAVEEKVAGADAPDVFFEIYGQPLMTAGSGTIIDDLVTTAGGVNLGAAAGDWYPEYNAEKLVEEDPQVYIAVKGSMSDPAAIGDRPGFDQLAAVTDGRVYVIDDNLVTRPGPRVVLGLQQIAQMIHPELFGSPTPEASPAG